MTISVIVKGGRFVAAQAATIRRLPMAFVRETEHGETIGRIGDQFYERVARWYLEDIRAEPGKGFPAGSLLHYSQISVDVVTRRPGGCLSRDSETGHKEIFSRSRKSLANRVPKV